MTNFIPAKQDAATATVATKLRSLLPALSATEARIAHHILANLNEISFETGASLAKKVATSEISVSRFLRKAGYKSIAGLKRELQSEASSQHLMPVRTDRLSQINSEYAAVRDLEVRAIQRMFEEFESDHWRQLVKVITEAQEVFITGFQSVRGTAEDFARRLGLARDAVRYLSAHDNMLAEWLHFQGDARPKPITLILIDVLPYGREGLRVAEIAKQMGISVVVISDEFCDWAHGLADHTVFAKSRSGLYLESTVALVLALNVLVDSVARASPQTGRDRFDRWQLMTSKLGIF